VRTAALLTLALAACQTPAGGGSGLVVLSDTNMVGQPPACEDDPTGTGTDTGTDTDGEVEARAGEDPGTTFCAAFKNEAACDGTPRMDGEVQVGECRWVTVIPVLPGTCEATVLYGACVHVPKDDEACGAALSCGQIGLGVFGRAGCDGTVEIVVNPPSQAFCKPPTDWPLCWPDDSSPECTCVCE
jgi:hypothetical protein